MRLRSDSLDGGDSTLNITLKPGEDRLVVIDSIERDQPYSFGESLGFETIIQGDSGNHELRSTHPSTLEPLEVNKTAADLT